MAEARAKPSFGATERLRRIEQRLLALGDPDSRWLASALRARRYYGGTIDARLTDAYRMERDSLLCGLYLAFFGHLSLSAGAVAIERFAKRYAATSWPRDRHSARVPEYLIGRPGNVVWLIMANDQTVPGWRQIYTILQSHPVVIAKRSVVQPSHTKRADPCD
jgi:hypothetical protein